MEWVEGIGNSIDEAKEKAFVALGVHEDDAEFEVISDARIGLFNRVKEEARVRARVRPATPRSKDDRRRKRGKQSNGGGSGQRKGNRSGGSKGRSEKADRKDAPAKNGSGARKKASSRPEGRSGNEDGERPAKNQQQSGRGRGAAQKPKDENMEAMTLPEQADIAESFMTGLAERFGQSVSFERTDVDENEIRIEVSGEDLGRMIGRRGATANAIDELVRTVLQRRAGSGRDGRIRVDIGGVASRREESLRQFCVQVAEKVRESGNEIALEPMRGSDRKVVHDAMSAEDGVDTTSEGEDPNRRVVVIPAGNDA